MFRERAVLAFFFLIITSFLCGDEKLVELPQEETIFCQTIDTTTTLKSRIVQEEGESRLFLLVETDSFPPRRVIYRQRQDPETLFFQKIEDDASSLLTLQDPSFSTRSIHTITAAPSSEEWLQTTEYREANPEGIIQASSETTHVLQDIATDTFYRATAHLHDGLRHIYNGLLRPLTSTTSDLNWWHELRMPFEHIFFNVMNEKWFRIAGYNPDDSHAGLVGDESLHNSRIRITHINGILNGAQHQVENAECVSALHGNYPVHYVYSSSHGFSGDVLRGFATKVGAPSKASQLLAHLWKKLLGEMEEDGVILHYAHSLGGTETATALLMLPAEERQRIQVATFGSATLLDNSLCRKADNYVSINDGVPYIDLIPYLQGLLGQRTNIHFLSSTSLPVIDHAFLNETYQNVVEELGTKFKKEYLESLYNYTDI